MKAQLCKQHNSDIMSRAMTPITATLEDKSEETLGVVTMSLRIESDTPFEFQFGQFNMLSVFGVGEVAISIMGRQENVLLHTIRSVGRVTHALTNLIPGQQLGIRGPFGQGWPIERAIGKDLIFITAGLGCAPVVAAIKHAVQTRKNHNRIVILQGVKHHRDLLWLPQYEIWRDQHQCQVLLAASEEHKRKQHWKLGLVTGLLEQARFDAYNCIVMMCGPEIMMKAALEQLESIGVPDDACYLSMERNFQCGQGFCGHCQIGPYFVCKDGPVFHFPSIKPWFGLWGL
ncbi:FAD/NAD(P)-binding protein [Vibrio hangzhouensis]|uniref:NAD(P)H-flavin reductase n=1 Tax=Vibrio hangzhouensis TaxID=462991 RepID=A0A1H5RPC5_9VIBR|nr:FAD/NAD(P)-binding protein [Vibrio hangzhouensis]SEF39964.1 NAD(P)H-flavin reductase [Vibrio hangzhouensis]